MQTSHKNLVLAAAFAAGTLGMMASTAANAGAIIKYGDTILGINNEGQLNYRPVDFSTEMPAGYVDPISDEFNGVFGLFKNGLGDATSPGCLCEGWGVAVTVPGGSGFSERIAGGANEDDGGAFGISGGTFGSTTSTATSTVYINGNGGGFGGEFEGVEGRMELEIPVAVAAEPFERAAPVAPVSMTTDTAPVDTVVTVSHAFGPSLAQGVFQASVTITNNTDQVLGDLVYRRAMDWDIPLTEFDEYVTHNGVAANLESNGGNVRYASDNGFASVDPRNSVSEINNGTTNVDFIDNGPEDHGSVFDFAFGELAAGESRTFNIFYGSTNTEAEALNAVNILGVDVYSFGQSNGGQETGAPGTFIFAFGGVGGVEPGETEDVPVLPFVVAPGEFSFVAPEPRRWFDPPFADGFKYELEGGATFLSVTLPSAAKGFGDIDVVVDGIVVATLSSDDAIEGGIDTFTFAAGVSSFELRGLDMPLDIADSGFATAFPVFLDFEGLATELLQTALLVDDTIPAPISAPSAFIIMLMGSVLLIARRKKA